MSRIGKQPITIPSEVEIIVSDNIVSVKSSKSQLSQEFPKEIKAEVKDSQVIVSVKKKTKSSKAYHGLTRALIANMIEGVTKGFTKILELQGTGYRVAQKGNDIELSLGFSHPVIYSAPEGVKIEVKDQKVITISGANKQQVGQAAANIRAFREPDSYKGKGVRYQGEVVKLKPGKAAKAAGAE